MFGFAAHTFGVVRSVNRTSKLPGKCAASSPGQFMRGKILRPNIVVLIGLAWLIVAAQLLAFDWNDLTRTLLDTDDAMRLVQVRELLAGKGWFDLHEVRLGPPVGYDSHWSRLVDGGLAGLFLFFNMFVNSELAERLMRATWPVLWLLPAICGVAAIAWRIAGREAALVALLVVAVGMPAFNQFRPGRVDHHNVQIALALLSLAAVMWSDRMRWAGFAAGVATVLALAVGYEVLPFLVIAGAALVVRFVMDRRAGEALSDYGLALAAGMVLVFVATIGPDRWAVTACDALAVNMAAPVVLGGLALIAARWPPVGNRAVSRVALATVAAAVAGLAFVTLEPRCLGGPFAMVDRSAWAIWLDHVNEMRPLLDLANSRSDVAAAMMAFPAVAVGAAGALLVQDAALRRDFGFLTAVAALALAVLMAVWSVKMFSYAMWFGMPVMAAGVLRLCGRLAFATPAARAFVAILLAPAAISAGAVAVVHAAVPRAVASDPAERQSCFETENYAALAALPPGLMVADVDYGPFLLALTPHSVVAAPYHRAFGGIRTIHRLFTASPDDAHAMLMKLGATYLAICAPRRPPGLSDTQAEASFYGHLKSGEVPNWLEPLNAASAFAVYRVTP